MDQATSLSPQLALVDLWSAPQLLLLLVAPVALLLPLLPLVALVALVASEALVASVEQALLPLVLVASVVLVLPQLPLPTVSDSEMALVASTALVASVPQALLPLVLVASVVLLLVLVPLKDSMELAVLEPMPSALTRQDLVPSLDQDSMVAASAQVSVELVLLPPLLVQAWVVLVLLLPLVVPVVSTVSEVLTLLEASMATRTHSELEMDSVLTTLLVLANSVKLLVVRPLTSVESDTLTASKTQADLMSTTNGVASTKSRLRMTMPPHAAGRATATTVSQMTSMMRVTQRAASTVDIRAVPAVNTTLTTSPRKSTFTTSLEFLIARDPTAPSGEVTCEIQDAPHLVCKSLLKSISKFRFFYMLYKIQI